MKVFISWSGEPSRLVAEALREWLPSVIQGIDPFVSSKDINKGANWNRELFHQLSDSGYGIICLTQENLLSPWLNYEAGAIMKSVESRVAPILFHVEKGEVKPPMSHLQLTSITEDDFKMLISSINDEMGRPMEESRLEKTVSVWWPHLDEKIKGIKMPGAGGKKPSSVEPDSPRISLDDRLDEILSALGRLDHRMGRLESRVPRISNEFEATGMGVLGNREKSVRRRRVVGIDPTVECLEDVFRSNSLRARVMRTGNDRVKVLIKVPTSNGDLKTVLSEIRAISDSSGDRIIVETLDTVHDFKNGEESVLIYPES